MSESVAFDGEELRRCQRLWQAVLIQQVSDAAYAAPEPRADAPTYKVMEHRARLYHRAKARHWFAHHPRCVEEVCELAGFPASSVARRIDAVLRAADEAQIKGRLAAHGENAVAPLLRALRRAGYAWSQRRRGEPRYYTRRARSRLVLHGSLDDEPARGRDGDGANDGGVR